MIDNLCVGPVPDALGRVELTGLGCVNVVAGRNNSGKSTLLAAICDSELAEEGFPLVGERFETMWRVFEEATSARTATSLQRDLRPFWESVFPQEPQRNWYRRDEEQFIGRLMSEYAGSSFANYQVNYGHIAAQYRALFRPLPARALIPAKRSLGASDAVNSDAGLSPNGSGVLSRLFLLRNQLRGSTRRALFDEIDAAFTQVTEGYSFAVSHAPSNQVRLSFARHGTDWVSAEASGLGLQEVLLVITIANQPDWAIVCIEEPENHLHPLMQRRLVEYLRTRKGKQFFLSTHSNVLLASALTDRVFFTSFNEQISVVDVTRRAAILEDLGYSVAENLAADMILLVEGSLDRPVYRELLQKWDLAEKHDIKIWPLCGDAMSHMDLSVFDSASRLLAVLDSDPKSETARAEFRANCERVGIPVHQLQRYSIENYFPLDVIREVFRSESITLQTLAPNVRVRDQLGFEVKKMGRRLAERTSRQHFEQTDIGQLMERISACCAESLTPGA